MKISEIRQLFENTLKEKMTEEFAHLLYHNNSELPKNKTKKNPLTKADKKANR